MQSGRLQSHDATRRTWKTTIDDPVLSRANYLESQTSDFLLESLLRRYPIPVSDVEAVSAVACELGSLVLTFSHDRAAANFVVLRWLFRELSLSGIPANVYPHAEACVLHGVQLARTRPKAGKPLVAASFSFTRFLRNWRSAQALRTELVKFVREKFDHRSGPAARRFSTAPRQYGHRVVWADGGDGGPKRKHVPAGHPNFVGRRLFQPDRFEALLCCTGPRPPREVLREPGGFS